MSKIVEFLFDVGSPNAYLAYARLPGIVGRTGATVLWTPMLLGGVFKATGNQAPGEVPAKGDYVQLETTRFVARYGIPYQRNPDFPINTLALMRGAVSHQMDGDFDAYMKLIFEAMWVHPQKLDDEAVLKSVLTEGGFDWDEFCDRIGRQAVKDRLRANTEDAAARGVFGAPSFFVGEELFFGQDRLDWVEEMLAA
jgi:2-hydroxychromene-2-carboxylate isomerase